MVHPNILGPYLLFVLPIFLALLAGARERLVRFGAAVVCATGYAGLIATMSRLPIAIGALQAAAVLVCMAVIQGVSLKRIIGCVSFAGIAAVLASAYFVNEISQRINGDLSESISFRANYNRVALRIWSEHPVLGIGLNNFNDGLAQYEPRLSKTVDEMQKGREQFGVRAAAPVHNLYLLLLAETGAFGLAAFLVLLVTAWMIAAKSARQSTGPVRLVCIGIAIGLAGQYIQQTMDFSMWMDPGLMTFVLLFILAARPPQQESMEAEISPASQRELYGLAALWRWSPRPFRNSDGGQTS